MQVCEIQDMRRTISAMARLNLFQEVKPLSLRTGPIIKAGAHSLVSGLDLSQGGQFGPDSSCERVGRTYL